MFLRVLQRCPEILELDRTFLGQMCNLLKTQEFEPFESICEQGDVMHEFYILGNGKVQSVVEPPDDGVDVDELEGAHSLSTVAWLARAARRRLLLFSLRDQTSNSS